jgi:hypothetical protein
MGKSDFKISLLTGVIVALATLAIRVMTRKEEAKVA